MSSLLQSRGGISAAILIGLKLERGPLDGLESRSVEVAPGYIQLLHETRALFVELDLDASAERTLLHLTSSLLQMQDLSVDLHSTLNAMLESGRAEISGQQALVANYLKQLEVGLEWLEEKIETMSLTLDPEFTAEMSRRIQQAPRPSANNRDWKQELASLCD